MNDKINFDTCINVGSDYKFWDKTINDKSQESVVSFNFGGSEIVAFFKACFGYIVFLGNVNIVLDWSSKC